MKHRYIFIVGGVMSSVGKGVSVASIATILQAKGYRVTAIKIDPYVNVDAGTMNPTEHGEVFVTVDGRETDQDIGNYERFLQQDIPAINYMTTGLVYQSVIQRERNLGYGGRCVEVVPDIPNEVIKRIEIAAKKAKADFTVVEIGGTLGEYQNILFLEAARMMKTKYGPDVLFVLVSYLPIPSKVGEMKTKPTQYAARTLNSAGIQTNFIIGRSEKPLDNKRREKLATFCNIQKEDTISAPDIDSIYEVPVIFEKEDLGNKILKKVGLQPRRRTVADFKALNQKIARIRKTVTIGLVGKYFATGEFTLIDSYISVIEAVKHACWHLGYKPEFKWINSEDIEKQGTKFLDKLDGIIIPQGWGSRGTEGKIKAIQYARTKKKPYLGLCFGMQMAVIEFARNVCKLEKANSTEVDAKTPHPVIHIMPNQKKYLEQHQYGGTIRLGAWPCRLKRGTKIYQAYRKNQISERHRHRYEFNIKYKKLMEAKGLTIAGSSPDGKLVEAIEITDHPFFVGIQFHPEYQSRPLSPHPLFVKFIEACTKKRKSKL